MLKRTLHPSLPPSPPPVAPTPYFSLFHWTDFTVRTTLTPLHNTPSYSCVILAQKHLEKKFELSYGVYSYCYITWVHICVEIPPLLTPYKGIWDLANCVKNSSNPIWALCKTGIVSYPWIRVFNIVLYQGLLSQHWIHSRNIVLLTFLARPKVRRHFIFHRKVVSFE